MHAKSELNIIAALSKFAKVVKQSMPGNWSIVCLMPFIHTDSSNSFPCQQRNLSTLFTRKQKASRKLFMK